MKNAAHSPDGRLEALLKEAWPAGDAQPGVNPFMVAGLAADPVLAILSQYANRLIVYDSGVYGAHFVHYLLINNIVPLGVCDADPGMAGDDLYGFTVMSLQEAGEKFGRTAAFLIADRDAMDSSPDSPERSSLAETLAEHGCDDIIFLEKDDLDKHWTMHRELLTWPTHSIKGGARFCADKVGLNYYVSNGERRTTDQPAIYDNHVYILGNSVGFSYGAGDSDTVASCLQRILNANDFKAKVVNYCAPAITPYDVLLQLRALNLAAGDKVVMFIYVPFQDRDEVYDSLSYCRFVIAARSYCESLGAKSVVVFTAGLVELDFHTEREKHLIAWRAQKYQDLPEREMALEFRSSCLRRLAAHGCPVFDFKEYFNSSPEDEEIFLDYNHLFPKTNARLAAYLYRDFFEPLLKHKDVIPAVVIPEAMRKLGELLRKQNVNNLDFKKWLSEVPRPTDPANMKIGAAVVNCNPFTNGHLYLLENASSQVDLLYVFVVEEDKSVFPFKDRFQLVREGTAHLEDKIIVCPSGQFIISSFSFKDYFVKDSISTTIDPSMDVLFFGAVIAPKLGITRRFVGEEPLCNVTRQYNETMLKLLPDLGVEVSVIPRKENNTGTPISASFIRNCLNQGDMESIKRCVPPTTYKYLKERASL